MFFFLLFHNAPGNARPTFDRQKAHSNDTYTRDSCNIYRADQLVETRGPGLLFGYSAALWQGSAMLTRTTLQSTREVREKMSIPN